MKITLKRNLPFSARIGISIFLVCGTLSISSSIFIYQYLKEKIWQTTRTQLMNISNIYSRDISNKYHKEIKYLKDQIIKKGIKRDQIIKEISKGHVRSSIEEAAGLVKVRATYLKVTKYAAKLYPTIKLLKV